MVRVRDSGLPWKELKAILLGVVSLSEPVSEAFIHVSCSPKLMPRGPRLRRRMSLNAPGHCLMFSTNASLLLSCTNKGLNMDCLPCFLLISCACGYHILAELLINALSLDVPSSS